VTRAHLHHVDDVAPDDPVDGVAQHPGRPQTDDDAPHRVPGAHAPGDDRQAHDHGHGGDGVQHPSVPQGQVAGHPEGGGLVVHLDQA